MASHVKTESGIQPPCFVAPLSALSPAALGVQDGDDDLCKGKDPCTLYIGSVVQT